MHYSVTFTSAGLGEGMGRWNDQRISPVMTMIHEATAGGAADEFGGRVAGGAGIGPFLAVAKSKGRFGPAIKAQADGFGFGKVFEH